jgi:hypothetical protein
MQHPRELNEHRVIQPADELHRNCISRVLVAQTRILSTHADEKLRRIDSYQSETTREGARMLYSWKLEFCARL